MPNLGNALIVETVCRFAPVNVLENETMLPAHFAVVEVVLPIILCLDAQSSEDNALTICILHRWMLLENNFVC